MVRAWSRLVLAGILVVSLGGCSPDSLGITGLSVDADGSPVIALAVCRGHIDSAGLLDTGTDGKGYTSAGAWTSRTPVGKGLTLLPVAAPPPGWVQERPLRPLAERVRYVAWGSTEDNNGATAGFPFEIGVLGLLTPETVMYRKNTVQSDGSLRETDDRVKLSDFQSAACSHKE